MYLYGGKLGLISKLNDLNENIRVREGVKKTEGDRSLNMSYKGFLGGVRVLRPSAANLRDPPPQDVFDSFPS